MRSILLLSTLLSLVGCAVNPEIIIVDNCGKGYRPEDVKVLCGEKWDQQNRHPLDAQIRKSKGEQW